VNSRDDRAAPPAWAKRAVVAHVVYSPEVRHPVEVGADQEAHLVAWLSKRLNTTLRIPQLGGIGYSLVGGRLLPGEQGPAAQFMYQDGQGLRLTLYVRTDRERTRETAFRFSQDGNVRTFYWIDHGLGLALSGEIDKDELLRVATAVYQQLNP
jgi:anti-sigma factor RsiW